MRGKSLSQHAARRGIEAYRRDPSYIVPESEIGQTGDGDWWDERRADRLADLLRAAKDALEESGEKADAFTFDAPACRIVHETLALPSNLAADDGFWRWLAVAKCPDVVEARHAGKESPAHVLNFGIGPVTSNRLAILWYRADMVYDANRDNPYHLATHPSHTDFWESGVIRPRYGWSRNLARALVRCQYRNPGSRRAHLHSTDPNGIRELYKRLRRLHSTIAFEFLSDGELNDLLEQQSQDLRRI